ncbi:4Fe-4S binding protein [Methanobrevibacter sp.]|uniref:4Fe-4S binding protein n=1 Tax=Methanobrevibacter sp. TaxID=66852 RepID=UPI003863175C
MVVQMPKHIASGLKYLAAVKLKDAGESHQAIANELGVDRSTISHYLNGSNLSWNSIDVARTITELSPRDFLIMAEAIFDEPEQSRKIVKICQERNFEVKIEDSCIGCGLCVNACLMKAIQLESLKAHADSIQCCGCQLCEDECPTNSIKILEI